MSEALVSEKEEEGDDDDDDDEDEASEAERHVGRCGHGWGEVCCRRRGTSTVDTMSVSTSATTACSRSGPPRRRVL